MARKKKNKGQQEGTSVPKSRIPISVIDQKVRDGESNVISMYCYHFGDTESKPPVEAKVCHKISPKTFNCTLYTGEHTSPQKKCRLTGFNEDGIPQVVIGCALSPLVEFERLRAAWADKGRKINPLKASRRAARRAARG